MVSLTQLEYVLAVEKYRHFGKAAASCHISQPTLSQQIQKLEDEVGLVIFDRVQKPVIPTERGKRFLEQAKIVIRENSRLLHLAKKGTDGVYGEFRLGIIPSVASDLVPLFIEQFAKTYKNVDLYIEELKTESVLDDLKNDRLDAGVLATPLSQQGFKVHLLYYEPFVLYLSEDHPLLRKKLLVADDLDGDQMWLLADGHCFRNQVINFCSIPPGRQAGVFKNVHFQGGSLSTLRNLVRKSHGYTMLPLLLTRQMSEVEVKSHVKFFKSPVPTREISLVYRRDHWKLEIIDAIEKIMAQSLPLEISGQKQEHQQILEIC